MIYLLDISSSSSHSVSLFVFPSLLMQSWGVPGDVCSGVHPVRSRKLLPWQRYSLWPMGYHACWIQKRGNFSGERSQKRCPTYLQQVTKLKKIKMYCNLYHTFTHIVLLLTVLPGCLKETILSPTGTSVQFLLFMLFTWKSRALSALSISILIKVCCLNSLWVTHKLFLLVKECLSLIGINYARSFANKQSIVYWSFFVQIQNDQCQEMDQSTDTKWLQLTNHGEWGTHTVGVFGRLPRSSKMNALSSKQWVDTSRKPPGTQEDTKVTKGCLQYFSTQIIKPDNSFGLIIVLSSNCWVWAETF